MSARRSLLFLVVAFVYLAGLAQVGIITPDEPRYSAIGVEMAHSGDWVTPRLWGHPWFEKSPLLYWMTGVATLFGLGPEAAPRVPVALTAFGLIVFLYWFLKPRLGEEIAAYSAILLAGAAGWIAFASVGVTDIALTAHTTVCVLLLVFGGPAWVAGIFLGLAVLAKGLVPFVLFLPLVWWLYREKRLPELVSIGIACLLVAGPWYAVVTLKHGHAFFDDFILKQHFARFSNDSLQHVRPVWFFVPVLAGLLIPWTGLLPFMKAGLKDPRVKFLAAWALFGFVFFSAGRNKLPGYVVPLIRILCVVLASALREVDWRKASPVLAVTAGFLVAFGVQILPALPQLLNEGWTRTPLNVPARDWITGSIVAVVVLWIARTLGKATSLCVVSGLMLTGLLAVKFGPVSGEIDHFASARELSRTAPKDGCVHPADRDLRYGLSYYWGFEVPECNEDTLPKRIRKN